MSPRNDAPAVIQTARAVEGWSQADLAERLRTAPSTVSRAERDGAESPPPSLMDRISTATEGRLPFVEQFVASYRVLQRSHRGPIESAADRADDLAAELASRFAAHLAPALTVLAAVGGGEEEIEAASPADQRIEAEALFQRLASRSDDERRFVVGKGVGIAAPRFAKGSAKRALPQPRRAPKTHWPGRSWRCASPTG